MSFEISGTKYFTLTEISEKLCISRQTLWRWRQNNLIPSGSKHRNYKVVYSEKELQFILDYFNQLEPLSKKNPNQLGLFNGNQHK